MDVDAEACTTNENLGKYSAKKKAETMTTLIHPRIDFWYNILLNYDLKVLLTSIQNNFQN